MSEDKLELYEIQDKLRDQRLYLNKYRDDLLGSIHSKIHQIEIENKDLDKYRELANEKAKELGWKRYGYNNTHIFLSPDVPTFNDFLSKLDINLEYIDNLKLLPAYRDFISYKYPEHIIDIG